MGTVARNHHVVPQGYLAGFTDTGTRDGKLFVFDCPTGRFFLTKPSNVGVERDFNRINVEGQSPDALEKALGNFERTVFPVMRQMCKDDCIPPDEDFSYVINFICLLVVHNPTARQSMTVARQHSARMIVDLLASNKDRYEYHNRKARTEGFVVGPDVSFERMREFVKSDRYSIQITTDASLETEFGVFDKVLQLLGHRFWSLMHAGPNVADFVTCDRPATLAFKDQKAHGPIGFGLRHTEVVFPIDAKHALLGVFEDPLPRYVALCAADIAAFNTRIIRSADRQIYCRTPVVCVLRDGEIAELDLREEQSRACISEMSGST